MPTAKIAITIDENLLRKVDHLVSHSVFPSRSRAIQAAVEDNLHRWDKSRLAKECAKLDPVFEQSMAEEGIGSELDEWPAY